MSTSFLVLDGGMGRELLRIGAPFRQPEWSALALTEGPDWVVQAHRNFIDAGAQLITTNSYALVPFHIGEERFAAEARDLADLSGRLARQAAHGAPHPVQVAGSLPPLFGSYRPDLFDAADAPRLIDPLIEGLAPHVDLWLGETLGSIAEVEAVRQALDRAMQQGRAVDKPLWISYTLDNARPGTLKSGEAVPDAVAAAVELGAVAVLFNCCQAEVIGQALPLARAAAGPTIAIGGYANRFIDSHTDEGEANEQISEMRDDLDPETYVEMVRSWVDAGATLVGGCCGMTPEHIAGLSALAASL